VKISVNLFEENEVHFMFVTSIINVE